MGTPPEGRRLVIRGREISEADIAVVRGLIEHYGNRGRVYISIKLSEHWQWKQANGHLKDRACRSILQSLSERGLIQLPASKRAPSCKNERPLEHVRLDTTEIKGNIKVFLPLKIKSVTDKESGRIWKYVNRRYHYLGYRVLVGQNIRYLIYSSDRLVAALGWQSAVERLYCRDIIIGWNVQERRKALDKVLNNSRFLIMPWVEVKNIASHILSRVVRQLQKDWVEKYGTRLLFLETFIDPSKFSGTCYQAANWVKIGNTKGYRKKQKGFIYHGNSKEVYFYVLDPQGRQKIKQDKTEPLLTRKYLLSNRPYSNLPLERRSSMIVRPPDWSPEVEPGVELSASDIGKLATELEKYHALFEEGFRRKEQKDLSLCYLQGLLSKLDRKSIEPIALRLRGKDTVRSLQRFMGEYKWDGEFIASRHKEELSKLLSEADGVLSLDSREVVKKGKESVGVARQYCGRLGKIENCQSGVYVAYTSTKGYGLIDRRLYMPEKWFDPEYKERRERCKVPKNLVFRKKPELAVEMIAELSTGGLFPFRWITCDSIFGNSPDFLENLPPQVFYLADIAKNRKVLVSTQDGEACRKRVERKVSDIAQDGNVKWKLAQLAEGAKGPIYGFVARTRVFAGDDSTAENERWLFLRKDPKTHEIKYCLSNAPAETALEEMIRVCVLRWPVEQSFQEGKSELGMADYEHRSWPAWHRHMTFVFLAQLFLLRIRGVLKKNTGSDFTPSSYAVGGRSAGYST
ncbi:MAG: IS701 family transposase [Candidatus Scalindua sp.]|nr:IS701 family transposase [Candidatus Scalindua sp.]